MFETKPRNWKIGKRKKKQLQDPLKRTEKVRRTIDMTQIRLHYRWVSKWLAGEAALIVRPN